MSLPQGIPSRDASLAKGLAGKARSKYVMVRNYFGETLVTDGRFGKLTKISKRDLAKILIVSLFSVAVPLTGE